MTRTAALAFECEPYGGAEPLRLEYGWRSGPDERISVAIRSLRTGGVVLSREDVTRLRIFLEKCEAKWSETKETPLITDDE